MPERHIFGPDDAGQFTTLLNAEFDKIWTGGASGGGFGAWYGSGRFVADEGDALAPHETATPSLNIVLPDGLIWLQSGVPATVEGDTLLGPLPAEFSGYLALSFDEDGAPVFTTDEARGALGSGTLAYFETDAQGVTLLEASAAKSDVIPALPYLLTLLYAGSGNDGEGGAVFWELLKRSAVNPQTIAQFVSAEIEARLGGTGTNLLPPEVRDEVMVNALHSLALHQMSVNNAFENVPPHHALVVSPGRGSGDWAYDELTDEALTTMPVNIVDHEFGSAA